MLKNKLRPTKIEHYLNRAKTAAERSTCVRRRIGAIIVKNDVEISSGYVGAPRKMRSCSNKVKCLRISAGVPSGQRYELCRSVHAEQNALINAGRIGVNYYGGDMYISSQRILSKYNNRDVKSKKVYGPCLICKKLLINAGIKNVHMREEGVGVKSYTIGQIKRLLVKEEAKTIDEHKRLAIKNKK